MADTPADRLVVTHHDDRESIYEFVRYCVWPSSIAVYRDGVEIARHEDVLTTDALVAQR